MKFLLLGIISVFCVISLNCEYNIETQTEYNNFSGEWRYNFIQSQDTSSGIYNLREDGNVDCTGQNCVGFNSNDVLISRTWSSIGDRLTVILKYREPSNNNRLVTGTFEATQSSKNYFSGTLSYSTGSQGKWSATKILTENDKIIDESEKKDVGKNSY